MQLSFSCCCVHVSKIGHCHSLQGDRWVMMESMPHRGARDALLITLHSFLAASVLLWSCAWIPYRTLLFLAGEPLSHMMELMPHSLRQRSGGRRPHNSARSGGGRGGRGGATYTSVDMSAVTPGGERGRSNTNRAGADCRRTHSTDLCDYAYINDVIATKLAGWLVPRQIVMT